MTPFEQIKFYMRIPLPDGGFTNGTIDYAAIPRLLKIAELDLSDKRVLDIAANDGFWTFWAENRGSDDLLAIDVESFEKYDWNWEGPPASLTQMQSEAKSNWAEAGAGFKALHALFGSKAERRDMNVYDLDPKDLGQFDLVFNFGLLYHLRHPLLSLDRCRAVCKGVMILETHLVNGFNEYPVDLFYRRDELMTVTNWNGPTESCVANWLASAGFPHVFSTRTNSHSPYTRRIFVACVTEEWASHFAGNDNLVPLDEEYHDRIRLQTIRLLSPHRE